MTEDNFKSVGDLVQQAATDVQAGRPIAFGDYDATLWWEYLAARDKAETSRDIHDAAMAGRAYARWMAEFLPEPVRRAVHGNVVPIRK